MRYGVTLTLLALVACGGTDSSNNTTGGNNDTVAQLSIKSTGITTQTGGSAIISVPNPGFLQFTNSDTAAHNIASTDSGCTALTTGNLAAGATSSQIQLSNSTASNVTCSFKDTLNPSATAFTGTVTILTSSTGGSGY